VENPEPQENDEQSMARLIQTALADPARPLRSDEVDALIQRAVSRRASIFPEWALLVLAAGLLIIAALVWLDGAGSEIALLALLIPLANLVLSPLAAYCILKNRQDRRKGESQ
jgi:hypothetical protein